MVNLANELLVVRSRAVVCQGPHYLLSMTAATESFFHVVNEFIIVIRGLTRNHDGGRN